MFSLRSGSGGWGFEFQITHWSKTIIASRPSNVQIRMLETQIDKRARAGERANDGRREYSSTGSILTPTCLRFVFNSLLHPSASRCQLSPVAFVFDRGRWNNHNVYFRVYACVSRQQRFFFSSFRFFSAVVAHHGRTSCAVVRVHSEADSAGRRGILEAK